MAITRTECATALNAQPLKKILVRINVFLLFLINTTECNYNNVTTVTCLTPASGTFTSAQAWCKRSSSGSCYACSGCTEGQVCAQQGTSNTGACVTWTCNPRWYNDGSVCDCGCGAVDPGVFHVFHFVLKFVCFSSLQTVLSQDPVMVQYH